MKVVNLFKGLGIFLLVIGIVCTLLSVFISIGGMTVTMVQLIMLAINSGLQALTVVVVKFYALQFVSFWALSSVSILIGTLFFHLTNYLW